MSRPTLAPNGVIGLLVPWGNSTTQLEVAPLTPPGVCNAVGRFDFGHHVDLETELRQVAQKLAYAEPAAMLLALSPEMNEGGLERARSLQALIADASGCPAFTTTDGTLHELRHRGITAIGLITPSPQDRADAAAANFELEGLKVVRAHGMNCGISNIKATPLDDIADAFRLVDHHDVEALVQVGTGLPAFAIAQQLEAETGRPVITTAAAGYRQVLETLGLGPPSHIGAPGLDHLLVGATDKWASATFLAEMFDLPAPESYGPFVGVEASGTQVLFGSKQMFPGEFRQHLAFVVTDNQFDSIMDRLHDRNIQYFAAPGGQQPGEINHRTGRGVYFRDPDDHSWEAMTQSDRGLM